ncbi:hypothetical protein [Streptomyces scabichelini]|nr:hypothetical protein [Streptomyces scabichelini]
MRDNESLDELDELDELHDSGRPTEIAELTAELGARRAAAIPPR